MAANTQLYLIVGGAAAIVLAILWRAVARHNQTSHLTRRLRSAEEPADRARAGNELIDLGLRRAAQPVLKAMPSESDARVRQSVALAVARRQWEPSGADRVAQLRRWAADQLDTNGDVTQFGPAVTRLSDMGGPRLPPRQPQGAPAGPANAPPVAPPVNASTGPQVMAPPPPAPPQHPPTAQAPTTTSSIPPAPPLVNAPADRHWMPPRGDRSP
jgi:hypothetical protein